jgi:hypothetical protein
MFWQVFVPKPLPEGRGRRTFCGRRVRDREPVILSDASLRAESKDLARQRVSLQRTSVGYPKSRRGRQCALRELCRVRSAPSVILSLRRIPIRIRDFTRTRSPKKEYNVLGTRLCEKLAPPSPQPQKHFLQNKPILPKCELNQSPAMLTQQVERSATSRQVREVRYDLPLRITQKTPNLRPIFFVFGDETCTNTLISLRAISKHGRR